MLYDIHGRNFSIDEPFWAETRNPRGLRLSWRGGKIWVGWENRVNRMTNQKFHKIFLAIFWILLLFNFIYSFYFPTKAQFFFKKVEKIRNGMSTADAEKILAKPGIFLAEKGTEEFLIPLYTFDSDTWVKISYENKKIRTISIPNFSWFGIIISKILFLSIFIVLSLTEFKYHRRYFLALTFFIVVVITIFNMFYIICMK